ncbi:hypothetical protein E2542_SST11099 [Spatholobus suberectus]|nr:hypothetical protein E2542_SST11099 [Spatholobus suberectus]
MQPFLRFHLMKPVSDLAYFGYRGITGNYNKKERNTAAEIRAETVSLRLSWQRGNKAGHGSKGLRSNMHSEKTKETKGEVANGKRRVLFLLSSVKIEERKKEEQGRVVR